uniref:G protein signaling modulator 1a n=1 Tax=Monopterus albus TaxID=43700 RepID=A0A3Q3IH38_MONAL
MVGSVSEQELFLKMISHAQRGRMEEQRCFLQPSRSAEADAFFKMIASSQARRLDDQRVSLPNLPGISGDSEAKEHDRNINAEIPVTSPSDPGVWSRFSCPPQPRHTKNCR